MDDNGELDFSDHGMSSSSELARHFHSSAPSLDTFFDDLLKNTHSCTHMHTCNPPGPDKTHTHTCYHTHTQLFASEEEEAEAPINHCESGAPTSAAAANTGPAPKKKRPLGNREAVRKYREKKKAHTVFLEDQVAKLKRLNQQLVKRLQGQAALESEAVRLRALLSQFRTCIDCELGVGAFPYKSPAAAANPSQKMIKQALPGGFLMNAVNVPCVADLSCLHDQQPALDCPAISEGVDDLSSH